MNWKKEKLIIVIFIGVGFIMSSDIVNAGTNNSSELLRLAKEEFGNLTKAEERLFKDVAKGEIADYRGKKKENNDPNNAGKWGNERLIRGKCVEWLCTDKEAMELVTYKGIQVMGVRIDEKLDLQFIKIPFPLVFFECSILSGIKMLHAEIKMLSLQGTHTGLIRADGLEVNGYILLRNVKALEGVFLIGATIEGELSCMGGEFINRNGTALNCNSAKVSQNILLNEGFKAEGKVDLGSATIGGQLNCSGGEFINPTGIALNGDALKVIGNVYLRNGFKANGEVNLRGADIEGQLSCIGGKFINPNGFAINAGSIKVNEHVFLHEGFMAMGEVRLVGATIGGRLSSAGGQFINPKGIAINADSIKIADSVFLCNGFKAEGKVSMITATIGGRLDCTNGQFINPNDYALDIDSIKIEKDVFLRNGFKAEGEVRLVGAKIGGQLACTGGLFINPKGFAINASSLKVDKDIFLFNHFKAEGKIDFVGAEIGGAFIWSKIDSPENVTLDLRSATIGTLNDEQRSWPDNGKLFLNGLTYSEIFDKSPKDAKTRIEWIRRQYDKENAQFRPQPYEKLTEVLQKSGHENDAKEILIAKNKDKARLTQLTWSELLWYRVFGPMIGYGYRPWRAFWIGIVIVLLGWLFFCAGYRAEVMIPAKEGADASGGFCALVYSLDVFVPLVDLRQASYCMPNANLTGEVRISGKLKLPVIGKYLRYYLWFEVIMGWILTTLLVVGLTGLVRT